MSTVPVELLPFVERKIPFLLEVELPAHADSSEHERALRALTEQASLVRDADGAWLATHDFHPSRGVYRVHLRPSKRSPQEEHPMAFEAGRILAMIASGVLFATLFKVLSDARAER